MAVRGILNTHTPTKVKVKYGCNCLFYTHCLRQRKLWSTTRADAHRADVRGCMLVVRWHVRSKVICPASSVGIRRFRRILNLGSNYKK